MAVDAGAACVSVRVDEPKEEPSPASAHEATEVASKEESLESTSLQDLAFEDTDAFYQEFMRVCTDGTPFSLRIPFVKLSQFPPRLKEHVKASAHSSGVELWTQALKSLENADSEVEVVPERTFTIHLERYFQTDIEDSWNDYDAFVKESDMASGQMMLGPIPTIAPMSSVLRFAGHAFYGTRYGLDWAVKQDRKRWRWMLGLTVAGAGAGAAAGLLVGAAAGATAGLATGVVTSGRRQATVVVSRQGAHMSCP